MANPNPDTSGLKPFLPGSCPNPGGKTSEQRKLEIANAEQATRIRAALLAKVAALIDPESGAFTDDLTGDILKLIKDSEDRGLGAPKQTADVNTIMDVSNGAAEKMKAYLDAVSGRKDGGPSEADA